MLHGNLLNPREHRIFDFQKNVSGRKKKERKKNKEGFRVASGDKLTEATKKFAQAKKKNWFLCQLTDFITYQNRLHFDKKIRTHLQIAFSVYIWPPYHV